MTKPTLLVTPVQTSVFHHGEDLVEFILQHVDPSLWQERSILAITSKIVSLAEGRRIPQTSIEKKKLIRQEAEHYLGEIGHGVTLTIKQGLLLAAAGIDESNSENGDYILHPRDPFASAEKIRAGLRKTLGLKELGIILTDSKTGPLRRGVVGAALSFAGFRPVKDMIGHNDLFGRPLKMTKINVADSLAAIAVLLMGEAAECRPLALMHNLDAEFTDEALASELIVAPDEDMYLPLYQHLIK